VTECDPICETEDFTQRFLFPAQKTCSTSLTLIVMKVAPGCISLDVVPGTRLGCKGTKAQDCSLHAGQEMNSANMRYEEWGYWES
jgi:hypothetical protein